MCRTVELANVLVDTLNELVSIEEVSSQQLSILDKQLSEAYHDLETLTFNASQGYKIAKHIQEILHERRKVKNEFSCIQSLSQSMDIEKYRRNTLNVKQKVDKVFEKSKDLIENRGSYDYIFNT
ncbi:hypothetical protein [Brevibacillus laterosporus]|uniref:Uncharacterized protein n=1 Tax=Brevibacillus laterosporus TaxID=1465 RepID=A0AAP8QGX2_BRELA|nr:hypothetical protein [Brevibacillus laterosporus]MBG9773036.1 hypothetical protein [Brevibacillus laterosporus]PPB12987.1 hypothetical protein C4A77_00960 [Brevibacillus laterosporus]